MIASSTKPNIETFNLTKLLSYKLHLEKQIREAHDKAKG